MFSGAADAAVHVSMTADGDRRPDAGYRAAGGNRVDQADAGIPIERYQLTGGGVDCADTQYAVGPVMFDGSRCSITWRRTASETVSVDSATAADPLQFLGLRAVFGVNIAVRKQFGDLLDSDVRVQLGRSTPSIWRSNSASRSSPLMSCAATVEPADVPTRDVRLQQHTWRVARECIGDAPQDSYLPRDARHVRRRPAPDARFVATGSECARRLKGSGR